MRVAAGTSHRRRAHGARGKLGARRGRRRLGRPAAILTAANAALVVAASAFAWFGSDTDSPTSFIVVMPQWLWVLPALALAALCLALRARGLVAANAAVLCLGAVYLGGWQLAVGSPAGPTLARPTVRLVTWNVDNQRAHRDEIREKLLALKPDVVCLQEAFDPTFTGLIPGWDHVDVLGVRIQSRWPMTDAAWFGRDVSREYRPWAACEVRTPVGELVVLDVHFTKFEVGEGIERHTEALATQMALMALRRENQAVVVLRALPPTGPAVVAGDFNLPPACAMHRALARRMTDSFAATRFGFGYTFLLKRLLPTWRIDYVWAANGVRPVRTFLDHAYPSDHRPLVADLILPAP